MPYCFIGRLADAPGLLRVIALIGPFTSLVMCV